MKTSCILAHPTVFVLVVAGFISVVVEAIVVEFLVVEIIVVEVEVIMVVIFVVVVVGVMVKVGTHLNLQVCGAHLMQQVFIFAILTMRL